MSAYNGHRNHAYWNVALWLGNDEGLYRTALELKREYRGARKAAEAMLSLLEETAERGRLPATPDGVPYTVANLTAAIAGLE